MLIVARGPSLLRTSEAITRAIVTEIEAREQREEAHRRWFEQAVREVHRRPDRVKWVEPHGRPSE